MDAFYFHVEDSVLVFS